MQEITPNDSVVPIYLVPLTKEEIEERKQLEIQNQQRKQEEQGREEARTSALNKLAKLGLTEEEVKAIIGI